MSSKKSKKKPPTHGLNRATRDMLMVTANPIWRAFAKEPVLQKSITSIGLSGRKSLYALTNGAGEVEHCKELMLTAHACVYLAEQGYGTDLMDDFTAGLATIQSCQARARDGLGYALEPAEAGKVDVLLDLCEQQLGLAEKAEVSDAIVESYKRVGEVLA